MSAAPDPPHGDDPFRPTTAAPQPEPIPVAVAADATPPGQPAGSALPGGGSEALEDPHPEKKVGKAFGAGLGAAIVLKVLAKRRHA